MRISHTGTVPKSVAYGRSFIAGLLFVCCSLPPRGHKAILLSGVYLNVLQVSPICGSLCFFFICLQSSHEVPGAPDMSRASVGAGV